MKERPGFPVTDCGANGRAFQEQRKEGRQQVRGEEGETKEVTLATAFSESEQDKAFVLFWRQATQRVARFEENQLRLTSTTKLRFVS